MKDIFINILGHLNYVYVFIIILNILIFIFARFIINFLDTTNLEKIKLGKKEKIKILKKTIILRFLSVLILVSYVITLWIKASFINDLIASLFVIIIAYITNSWILKRLLLFYWEEVEISGHTYIKRDYKINLFWLLVSSFTVLISIFFIFKIFEIDSILQSGWIIAWVLAFIWFTAPVWAPDLVAGISILHNDQVEIWNVVRIKELWVLAWIKNLNLSEVRLIDLSLGHPIIMRPSRFRELKVENLSLWVAGKRQKIPQYIDADIYYGFDLWEVKNVFFEAWEEMIHSFDADGVENKYFPEHNNLRVEIIEFWDDAVKYRFFYYISSPFYIIKVQFMLNPYLQKMQKKYGIDFSTPKLINLEK